MKISTTVKFLLRSKIDGSLFPLNKERIIVGSDHNCDIIIEKESISAYHAFLYLVDEDVILIKDLHSKGGVFINGNRFEETYLNPGDTLSFGDSVFTFEVSNEAPLELIDDEYCNITFSDKDFAPISDIPVVDLKGEYIELEETQAPFNLSYEVNSPSLEIINYINGIMSDIRYLKMKDGDYFISDDFNDHKTIPFSSTEKAKLISIRKGKVVLHPVAGLTPSFEWSKFKGDKPIFLTKGSEQVSLRLIEKSVAWRKLPLFSREKDFYTQSSKIFTTLFFPLLLLLFVTLPEMKVEQPEPIVVYKLKKESPPAVEKSELMAEKPTSETENTGSKETEQNPEKVEFAAASAPAESKAGSSDPTPSPAAPKAAQPPKKVAQTKPVKAPPAPPIPLPKVETISEVKGTPIAAINSESRTNEKAAPKPYKFKSSAMESLMSDSPNIASVGSKSSNNNDDKSFGVGTSDKGDLLSNSRMGVSKLKGGSDKYGTGEDSYGARGLASKKGFDSSYLEPNTTIRGSMDPELLRKILREYIPQFRHCYQQELARHSEKINGVVELNFTINPQGKSIRPDIRMKNAQFSREGVNCMVGVLNIIDFPKPKGGGIVDVRQPLTFTAENSK